MFELYIANKNYSSWSLRPWVLMRELAIPFVEHLLIFGDPAAWEPYRRLVPSGKVPALEDDPPSSGIHSPSPNTWRNDIPAFGRRTPAHALGRAAPPRRCIPVSAS
jgi:hypothetical protein